MLVYHRGAGPLALRQGSLSNAAWRRSSRDEVPQGVVEKPVASLDGFSSEKTPNPVTPDAPGADGSFQHQAMARVEWNR